MEKSDELTMKEQYLIVRVKKYLLKTKQDPIVIITKLLNEKDKKFKLDMATDIANNNLIEASMVLGIAERTFHRQRSDIEKRSNGTSA